MEGEREMIKSINRSTVSQLLEEASEALAVVADRHGIVLERKHCTYSETEVPVAFKFVIPERAEDGTAIDPKETEFRKYARRFGLEPDDYGKLFKTYNGVYRVSGIKPRGKKYPVLGEHVDSGRTFKFPASQVVDGLKREQATP